MESMHFSKLLNEHQIQINMTSTSLSEICEELIDNFYRQFELPMSKQDMCFFINKRLKENNMIIINDICFCHIRFENYDDLLIGIGIPAKVINIENQDVRIVFFVVTGYSHNSLYLHLLQTIAKISKNDQLREKLIHAKNAKDFIATISASDFSLSKSLDVGDLMSKNVFFVNQDSSLRELGNLFYEKNYGYCPVTDDNDNVIGEVTVLDLILAGFPEYTKYFETMNFLHSFEPLERLLNVESTLRVKDIMKKLECKLKPRDAIIESIFLMNRYKRRDIPVVENNKIIGIISFMDIFRKIIRG